MVSALFNIIGLILLYGQNSRLKQPCTNHRTLLISFSFSELYFSVSKLTNLVLIQTVGLTNIYRMIAETFSKTALFVYFLIMMLILVDRFFFCIFPIRYRVLFSKRKVNIASLIAWILGLSTGIVCPVVGFQEFQLKAQLAYLGFNIGFLLASCFVYATIAWKLKGSAFSSDNPGNSRYTKVTVLIVVTFLVFMAIPEIIVSFIAKENEDTFTNVWVRLIYAISEINFCIYPLIYVFGYQPVKTVFKQKLAKLCLRHATVSTVIDVKEIQDGSEGRILYTNI